MGGLVERARERRVEEALGGRRRELTPDLVGRVGGSGRAWAAALQQNPPHPAVAVDREADLIADLGALWIAGVDEPLRTMADAVSDTFDAIRSHLAERPPAARWAGADPMAIAALATFEAAVEDLYEPLITTRPPVEG